MLKRIVLLLIILFLGIGSYVYYNKFQNTSPNKKKFTFWSIQLKPIYEKEINELVAEFNKNHPDYDFVWVDIPIQEAQKRTLASILSSTPPDLINLNPDFSVLLAQRNALYFFDEKQITQFHPELINKLKYEDKIYALPFYATSPVTIYNKETYGKCIGNGFIKTYDDLFNISNKLKTCSNIHPFVSSLNENDTLSKILNKYNVTSFDSQKEKDNAIKIYTQFDKMYKNNLLPKDILANNHREVIEKYMSNQATIIVAGSNFISSIKSDAPDVYSKSALSEQLTGENGKFDVSLMNLIIPKKSQNIDLALEFALLLTNKENQLKLSKKTNVLPANKYALNDNYFKTCPSDLVEQSRCISAKQLDNLSANDFGDKNKKLINETINKTLEEILLNKNSSPEIIKRRIYDLSLQISNFINQS